MLIQIALGQDQPSLNPAYSKGEKGLEGISGDRIHTQHDQTVPSFVITVPSNHFAGISPPMPSIAEAKKAAVADVVRQVLREMGAAYEHRYVDRIFGNPSEPGSVRRVIDDQLSEHAQGILLGLERYIVRSSWAQNNAGNYVYSILVRYPDSVMQEMRRLSKGAKVVVSVVEEKSNRVLLNITEVNTVEALLTSAEIQIRKINRFAPIISYCILKVPKGSVLNLTTAIDPVRVRGNSKRIGLEVPGTEKRLLDYLLGAELERSIVLKGFDEIGQDLTVRITY